MQLIGTLGARRGVLLDRLQEALAALGEAERESIESGAVKKPES